MVWCDLWFDFKVQDKIKNLTFHCSSSQSKNKKMPTKTSLDEKISDLVEVIIK